MSMEVGGARGNGAGLMAMGTSRVGGEAMHIAAPAQAISSRAGQTGDDQL